VLLSQNAQLGLVSSTMPPHYFHAAIKLIWSGPDCVLQ